MRLRRRITIVWLPVAIVWPYRPHRALGHLWRWMPPTAVGLWMLGTSKAFQLLAWSWTISRAVRGGLGLIMRVWATVIILVRGLCLQAIGAMLIRKLLRGVHVDCAVTGVGLSRKRRKGGGNNARMRVIISIMGRLRWVLRLRRAFVVVLRLRHTARCRLLWQLAACGGRGGRRSRKTRGCRIGRKQKTWCFFQTTCATQKANAACSHLRFHS